MASSLEEFISHVKNVGLPLSNRFNVIIGGDGAAGDNQKVMMLCEALNLPGYNHMTVELRKYGEISEFAYGVTYPDISMTFYIDNTASAKKFFDDWSDQVFNKKTRSAGYYKNYVRPVELFLENKMGEVIYHIKLYEAFPKAIGDFTVDNNSRDTVKVQALMKYKWSEVMVSGASGDPIQPTSGIPGTYNVKNLSAVASNIGAITGGAGTALTQLPAKGESFSATATKMQSGIPKSASTLISGLSSSPGNYAAIGGNVAQMTNQFSTLGSQINQIAKTPSNIVALTTGPISSAVGNIAGTVGGLGTLLGTVGGVTSGIVGAQAAMNNVKSALQNAHDIPTSISAINSLGSTIGALGGQIANISNSVDRVIGLPNTLKPIWGQFSGFGSAISDSGSSTSDAAARAAINDW